jgi:hypothetical protein
MVQIYEYYTRFQGFRGRLTALPAWARLLLGIVALPGILLALLSIAAFLVSLLALLVLALPVYRLVSWATGAANPADQPSAISADFAAPAFSGRRHVEVTVIDDGTKPRPQGDT